MLLGAVVMLLYLDRYVIPREEAYLGRAFGENYRAYRAKTRRWI
jgi:protein-S-isoprenylcysteine O-methyltransferase Ste14